MGLPEPIEPQPDDDAPAARRESRADWLCGPEEGLDAELLRPDAQAAPAPKLFRPGADAPADAAPAVPETRRAGPDLPAPRLTLPSAPEAGEAVVRPAPGAPPPGRTPGAVQPEAPSGFSHGPTMLWEPGGNSLPVLPRGTAPAGPHAAPPSQAPDLDFPMDDAEERARATAEAAAAAAAAAAASAPTAMRTAQPHAVVEPEAFDLKDAPAPWWMQLPQLLREDRRVQGLAALVAIVLLALLLWPRGEKSLSIGSIRRDAARYDGQSVRVSGRIGEIFEVGGGHAFYLHQGRDTLVVFTRSRTPRRGQGATVVGMISTGFLNGQSGTALFESAKP